MGQTRSLYSHLSPYELDALQRQLTDPFREGFLGECHETLTGEALGMNQHLQGRLDAEVRHYSPPFPGTWCPSEHADNEAYTRGYIERLEEISPLPVKENDYDELRK